MPVVLHDCETWSIILCEANRFRKQDPEANICAQKEPEWRADKASQ